MKLLTSPPLNYNNFAFVSTLQTGRYKWWFCRKKVLELFDIPKTTQKIWFEFYDCPAPGRYKVQKLSFDDSSLCGDMYVKFDGGREQIVAGNTVSMLVNKLKRTSCYVECYYE